MGGGGGGGGGNYFEKRGGPRKGFINQKPKNREEG